ncbi:MAG: ABC transporter ATP-binding protein [Candidatus Omnitrophota bacterium]
MLIKAENLHKRYRDGKRDLHVLNGVDISLDSKSVSAIIGPSGAGKSTLLHILGGLDEPSDGKVIFDGVDLYGISDKKRSLIRNRRIGFVFQFYHLLAEFSALENVVMPMLMGTPGKEYAMAKKAKCLLESVGLGDRIGHRPSELSGGEAQRVAIARALINEPDIVFCDEPTGNLDSENSEIVLKLIMDLNKNKDQAFLIVTHDEKVAGFADTVLNISDGVLI